MGGFTSAQRGPGGVWNWLWNSWSSRVRDFFLHRERRAGTVCAHLVTKKSSPIPNLGYSKDSMGNTEILKRGDLQLTSAGTGIRHSEKAHGPKQGLLCWTLHTYTVFILFSQSIFFKSGPSLPSCGSNLDISLGEDRNCNVYSSKSDISYTSVILLTRRRRTNGLALSHQSNTKALSQNVKPLVLPQYVLSFSPNMHLLNGLLHRFNPPYHSMLPFFLQPTL